MPEYDANDKLTLTLDTLRSDVERTPLADSMTVRRRGDQRTRRQAVGGALAVVALVAGVAGVLGGGGFNQADAPVATGGPTASTEVEKPLTMAPQPLLRPSDIGAVGIYSGWQLNADQAAIGEQRHQCVPSPTGYGASEVAFGTYYNDLDSSAVEHVLQFADSGSAAAAADALVQALTSCSLGSASDNVVQGEPTAVPVTGADSAFSVSRQASPPDSEVSYYELGVTRKANVLVVLQWGSMGLPDGVTRVWDADRMTTALDRAVG